MKTAAKSWSSSSVPAGCWNTSGFLLTDALVSLAVTALLTILLYACMNAGAVNHDLIRSESMHSEEVCHEILKGVPPCVICTIEPEATSSSSPF
ncbi:hypothetical protein [Stecheria intestinalis]|uniref:hypothetical protein n=1 Tax=Stecheria intestinalis TaxID=2606630 RepID=UPI00197E05A8|nr:hypothetical protein [Stecheria intestinalis]MCI6746357.1 hypothetical protein [Anaerolactibacter massiliensis]